MNVTVTDPYNRLVTGLEKENFRVYEDGVEQEVVTFSSEDVPISIGVIFDIERQHVRQGGQGARRPPCSSSRRPTRCDEFFLVSFNDRGRS